MLVRLIVIVALLLGVLSSIANENDVDGAEQEKLHAPTVGLGIGMLKFYGDVLDANYGNALISNIGYDLHVKQPLNNYFGVKFYVLFGRVSANERLLERNLNFQSKLTTGGFSLSYNFDHLLPKQRIISPIVSVGIESVEFHSKTDLYNEDGVLYHYWSDGSIRDVAENSSEANSASLISRDYTYETDLRELNLDGRGKYPDRTVSMPLGLGVEMRLTDHINFTVGATYHYTFSDLIDDVTHTSAGERIGERPGNKKKDAFLMSSFSVSYNFKRDREEEDRPVKFDDTGIDYLALENEDEDGDGVKDFIDQCPWTPEGVEVNEMGCPLDMDNDLVPNYRDDELQTREGAPVMPNGVELTDSMINLSYQRYLDLTGKYADLDSKFYGEELAARKEKHYKVKIGEYTEALDPELVDQLLSIPDVDIENFGDTLTVISVGNYDNLPDALKRKIQLTKEGFEEAIVVKETPEGGYQSVGDEMNNMDIEGLDNQELMVSGLLFRIQLGAFSKKQPKGAYNGLDEMLQIKASDGLYKYLYKQSFKTAEEAARKKIDLAIEYGIKDAFIVAYDDGQRITLAKAGVTSTKVETNIPTYTKKPKEYKTSAVEFRVQVGIYENEVPTAMLNELMKVEGIQQKTLESGLTRYTSRGFTNHQEALAYKNKLVSQGKLKSAFVIAVANEELIPVSKAKKMLGQ